MRQPLEQAEMHIQHDFANGLNIYSIGHSIARGHHTRSLVLLLRSGLLEAACHRTDGGDKTMQHAQQIDDSCNKRRLMQCIPRPGCVHAVMSSHKRLRKTVSKALDTSTRKGGR
jgi:hypothetical protein